MSKKEWAIFKTCRKRDQGMRGSGKPEFVNVIERDLGIHVSRDAAVRALVVNYYRNSTTRISSTLRGYQKNF